MKRKILLTIALAGITLQSFTQWQQIGVDIHGEALNDHFGDVLSINSDGSIVAIGSGTNDENGYQAGHVRIYRNENGNWIQIGSDIDGLTAGERIGESVCINSDGSIVVVGGTGMAVNGEYAGGARVYENQDNNWVQVGSDFLGTATQDLFGWSSSINGDGSIIAIGSRRGGLDGSNSGYVRVYENLNDTWTQVGSELNGTLEYDEFGWATCLNADGSVLAVSAPDGNGNGFNSGYVRIFENQNGTWVQRGSDIIGEEAGDYSGRGLSLSNDGSIVAIGAAGNGTNSTGHVRVFSYKDGEWLQIGSDINGESDGAGFGNSISLSSDGYMLAVGACMNSDIEEDAGQVRIYEYLNNSWSQVGSDLNGEAFNEYFGSSVSLSDDGSVVAIGAEQNFCSSPGLARIFENLSLGIVPLNNKLNIYPNPAKESVLIKNKTEQRMYIEILDITGKICKTSTIIHENRIDISNLKPGIYFLKAGTQIQKLVVE